MPEIHQLGFHCTYIYRCIFIFTIKRLYHNCINRPDHQYYHHRNHSRNDKHNRNRTRFHPNVCTNWYILLISPYHIVYAAMP